jgi:copper chaperone CopZ
MRDQPGEPSLSIRFMGCDICRHSVRSNAVYHGFDSKPRHNKAGGDGCCLVRRRLLSSEPETDNNQPLPANTEQVTFKIEGMTCASCEPAIRIALEKTPGVRRADVSYERGNAIVDYDPKETAPEKLRDVINGTGYKVKE